MTYIERMKVESEELNNKLHALEIFMHTSSIFNELTSHDQALMGQQITHMKKYLDVLNERISDKS